MWLRNSDDLCELVEKIGYKNPPYQLQCKNGAHVSSLLHFLDDNPGAMEVLYEWIKERYDLDKNNDLDDEEYEEDGDRSNSDPLKEDK